MVFVTERIRLDFRDLSTSDIRGAALICRATVFCSQCTRNRAANYC